MSAYKKSLEATMVFTSSLGANVPVFELTPITLLTDEIMKGCFKALNERKGLILKILPNNAYLGRYI